MGSPEIVVVINDSFLRTYEMDRTEAVVEAVREFAEYNQRFENDYRNASEEEKKMYVENIEELMMEQSTIRVIRVYDK